MPLLDRVTFSCPACGATASLSAVQGDRCPGCAREFTWFRAHEHQAALDFHAAVTGEKYLVELPGGGWVSVHR